LVDPQWAARAAERLEAEQFTEERWVRVAALVIGHTNEHGTASPEALLGEAGLADEASELLVTDESGIDEAEFEACLERIERQGLEKRVEQLREEIAKGTLQRSDQRYEDYLRLVGTLHGQGVKGEA